MDRQKKISSIFPHQKDIPVPYRLDKTLNQREYLAGGAVRSWKGPLQEVRSPICVRTSSGVSQKLLGSYPLLTEKESLQALDAAVQAYDNGRGAWPTMPVEERIRHLETFTHRMEVWSIPCTARGSGSSPR